MSPSNAETPAYGPGAFNSDNLPALPQATHGAPRQTYRRTKLGWGNYAHLHPWQDVGAQLQAGMQHPSTDKDDIEPFINHCRWTFENFNSLLILHPLLKWCCIVFAPWFLWGLSMTGAWSGFIDDIVDSMGINYGIGIMMLFVITSLILCGFNAWWMWREEPKFKKYLLSIGIGFLTAFIPSVLNLQTTPDATPALWLSLAILFASLMGLYGWDLLLVGYLRLFQRDGSEFNRQTGMLTIARRFNTPFSAPFYEFDATMEFRPGPHGNSCFVLWLHHRYSRVKVFLGNRVQSLGMNQEECLAFWDTLQRYMDVSQPLPELPVLEPFRMFDPTTNAYDELNNRPHRLWRNTKYRVWARKTRPTMMRNNQGFPWQTQGCIIEARVDPTLSVDDYYRAQHASGIQASSYFNNCR